MPSYDEDMNMNIHCSQLDLCDFESRKHHKCAHHWDKLKYATKHKWQGYMEIYMGIHENTHGKYQENGTPLEVFIKDTIKGKGEIK